MKNRASLLFTILFFFTAFSSLAHAGQEPAALTLMVYMCGSNLESRGGAGSKDLLEMGSSGYDAAKVNVLVMTGGSKRWALNIPKNALCIYTPDGENLKMLESYDSASMGDPSCLKTLLDYGYENFPAQRYALILWNHGGGPMNGVCIDELYRADTLTMEELYGALSASPAANEKLEWIGFDACLMGSAEVASLLSPFARYMIASEETEPGNGWDYNFLKGLDADPDGAATGQRIIDGYFAAADDGFDLTLSCVDLSKLEDLETRLDTLFDAMEIGSGNYALFSYAAGNTRSFGKAAGDAYSYDLIDLQALIKMLEPQQQEDADLALQALDEAVVCSRSTIESGGLSVYHPYENKADYAASWSSLYPALGFSEGYTDYISRFAGFLFGTSEVTWENLSAMPTGDAGIFALPLTEGQQEMLSGAVMHVLKWDENEDTYSSICSVNQLTLEDGVLYAPCPDTTLHVLGPNGGPVLGPVPYEILSDGTFTVYANYCMEQAADSPQAETLVNGRSEGLKRDFGSYSFDTDDTGTAGLDDHSSAGSSSSSTAGSDVPSGGADTVQSSSLSDIISATPAVTTHVSPVDADQLGETLTVPETVSLHVSATPVSSNGFLFQPQAATSGNAISPVSGEALTAASAGTVVIGTAGSGTDLSSLTPVGTQSFREDQIVVDLSAAALEQPDQAQQPEVLHARLQCRAAEDGSVQILETWLYDEESDTWSTRGSFDASLYPLITFPAAQKVPAAINGALTGIGSWTLAGTQAPSVQTSDLQLAFLPQAEAGNICIAFEVTDTQNQTWCSIPLQYMAE